MLPKILLMQLLEPEWNTQRESRHLGTALRAPWRVACSGSYLIGSISLWAGEVHVASIGRDLTSDGLTLDISPRYVEKEEQICKIFSDIFDHCRRMDAMDHELTQMRAPDPTLELIDNFSLDAVDRKYAIAQIEGYSPGAFTAGPFDSFDQALPYLDDKEMIIEVTAGPDTDCGWILSESGKPEQIRPSQFGKEDFRMEP